MAGYRLTIKVEARAEGPDGVRMWNGDLNHEWDNMPYEGMVAGQEILKTGIHGIDDAFIALGKASVVEKAAEKSGEGGGKK